MTIDGEEKLEPVVADIDILLLFSGDLNHLSHYHYHAASGSVSAEVMFGPLAVIYELDFCIFPLISWIKTIGFVTHHRAGP